MHTEIDFEVNKMGTSKQPLLRLKKNKVYQLYHGHSLKKTLRLKTASILLKTSKTAFRMKQIRITIFDFVFFFEKVTRCQKTQRGDRLVFK